MAFTRHDEISGRWNGSALRITAFTTLKMAVAAPMPRANVGTATAVKPKPLRRSQGLAFQRGLGRERQAGSPHQFRAWNAARIKSSA